MLNIAVERCLVDAAPSDYWFIGFGVLSQARPDDKVTQQPIANLCAVLCGDAQ